MSTAATPARHDVASDRCGFNSRYDRLTCYTPGCGEATLVGQPYMTQEVFDQKVEEFLTKHPCSRAEVRPI